MALLPLLEAELSMLGSAILGYSGGVDSAVLAVAGRRALGTDRFLAVIGRSDSYPAAQYRVALEIARRHDVPLLEVATGELEDPAYRSNRPDRCYHCKRELWARLGEVARERGFHVVLDGTNRDDLEGHRPGHRAAGERGVRSPLLELGWTKATVREAARELGIHEADQPSGPCLSSRIQYGLEVTRERLAQVESAEAFLRELGVTGDLRVRHRGRRASVEVLPEQVPLVSAAWSRVDRALRSLGFEEVTLEPGGYRRGGLLAELPVLGA